MKRVLSLAGVLTMTASMAAFPAFAESYTEHTSESYRIIDGEVIEHSVDQVFPLLTHPEGMSVETEATDTQPDALLFDDMIEVTVDEDDDGQDMTEPDADAQADQQDDDIDEDEADDTDAPLLTEEHAGLLQDAFDRAAAAQSIGELQTAMTDILNTLNMISTQDQAQ